MTDRPAALPRPPTPPARRDPGPAMSTTPAAPRRLARLADLSAGRLAPDADRPAAMVAQMRRLVRRNAARWRRLLILEALGLAVAVPLGYLWLVFLLDNTLYLPVWGRLVAAAGLVAAVAVLGARLVRRLRLLILSEDEV